MAAPTTAFVLGAGLGTRLRPLTLDCPKPLLPLHGRPLVTHVFDHLIDSGIRRIVVNTHHAPERWPQAFPDAQWRGVPLLFRHEPVLLGTAGGLKNIEDLLDGGTLLLHSGDVVANLPLEPLLKFHEQRQAEITLALRTRPGVETIGIDSENRIRHVGKRPADSPYRFHDYANVALIEPAFLDRIPDTSPRELGFIWSAMAREGTSLQGCVLNQGYWFNVGTPEEYKNVNTNPWPPA
jgi:NDP-sugar pyrophosphorylase family protein